MDFEFELSFDGNSDLYIKNKFSTSDVKMLIELEWLHPDTLEDFTNIKVLSNTILM